MCGGRGTRLDAHTEKPLFAVDGQPMVERVLAALADSDRIDAVRTVSSPHAPATRDHLRSAGAVAEVLDAPGKGYVADLGWALERVDDPVLTVAADLPLLDRRTVDRVLGVHEAGSLSVVVPAELKRRLGVSVDTTTGTAPEVAPTGVNVVGGPGTEQLTYDARLAVNVNRRADAAVAEALLAGDGEGGDRGP